MWSPRRSGGGQSREGVRRTECTGRVSHTTQVLERVTETTSEIRRPTRRQRSLRRPLCSTRPGSDGGGTRVEPEGAPRLQIPYEASAYRPCVRRVHPILHILPHSNRVVTRGGQHSSVRTRGPARIGSEALGLDRWRGEVVGNLSAAIPPYTLQFVALSMPRNDALTRRLRALNIARPSVLHTERATNT